VTATPETQRLTTQMHDAIAALAAHLGATKPGLSTDFDYQIDIHQADGGTYPLIFKTD
jgi:hypothetical protein